MSSRAASTPCRTHPHATGSVAHAAGARGACALLGPGRTCGPSVRAVSVTPGGVAYLLVVRLPVPGPRRGGLTAIPPW
jgi:hypothetical protein